MSLALSACDGSVSMPTECLQAVTDLSFCECNLCQVHAARTQAVPSPPLENRAVMTQLTPGVETNHTLCLNHWTFVRLDTASPAAAQSWREPEVDRPSTISAALGSLPSTPQMLTLTMDAEYDGASDRFMTVDAFAYTGALPPKWNEVHTFDYPASVWSDPGALTEFNLVDSFTHSARHVTLAPAALTLALAPAALVGSFTHRARHAASRTADRRAARPATAPPRRPGG